MAAKKSLFCCLRTLLVGLTLLGWTVACSMPSTEDETALLAYVANAGGNHVQVIDVASGETLRRIYAGSTPWRLVPAPDGQTLWVQHWLSETTAIVDLATHEVQATVPVRGPGVFDPTGERFFSFSWPVSELAVFGTAGPERLEARPTGISQVYDLAFADGAEDLFLVRFDPLSAGLGDRYAYLLRFPLSPDRPVPGSVRTGTGPVAVLVVPEQPFVLTADSETAALTLVNIHGDGRTVPTCRSPRRLALSPDGTRLVVLCWDRDNGRYGEAVVYHADFTARPWPELTEEAAAPLGGGPVAGALALDGALWVLDQPGRQLVELDPATLEPRRGIATGEVPADVVLMEVPKAWRDALAAGGIESPTQRRVREILTPLREASAPFAGVQWREKIEWQETPPTSPGEAENEGEGEATAATKTEPPALQQRVLDIALTAPDGLRRKGSAGSLSLAAGGTALTVRDDGRFWTTPRQELLSRLIALPNFAPDEALRRLAGDVPGNPYGAGGLAIDLMTTVEEGDRRYALIGALEPDQPVAQLWIDTATGRPVTLIEKFLAAPMQPTGSSAAFVETRFDTFQTLDGGVLLPTQLERVLDGQWVQQVAFEDAAVLPEPAVGNVDLTDLTDLTDLADLADLADLTELGGFGTPPVTVAPTTADGQPGRAVPILEHGYLDDPWQAHGPYNSNPPTSGPRLRSLAPWGVSEAPVPWPLQVHNLEHGAVVIQYRCSEPCPQLADQLAQVAAPWSRVIIAPGPYLPARIALTAWGRIDLLEGFDEERIVAFLEAWEGQHQH